MAYVSAAINNLGGDVTDIDLQNELDKTIPGRVNVTPNGDDTINVEFTDTLHNYNVDKGVVTKVELIVYGKEEWYTYEDDEDGVTITGFSDYINTAIQNLSSLEGTEYETLGNLPSSYNGKEVVAIGQYAFNGSILSKVIIPNTVIYLADGAFCNCQLTNITIPKSVKIIGSIAFYGNQLTNITIPDSVEEISCAATFANNNLSSVTFLGIPYIDTSSFNKYGRNPMFNENPNLIENTIRVPLGSIEIFRNTGLSYYGVSSNSFYEN